MTSAAGTDQSVRLGGRYELGSVLGIGATAEVRAAWDHRLQRPVAIKLLRPELAGEPTHRRRFADEARAAARLSHPHVVAVFDTGDPSGGAAPYIVMEQLNGSTLKARLDQGPMPVEEVRSLARQMLAALAAGAAVGLLHCDLKPGNIMAAGPGRWKLGDFGIASSTDLPEPDDTLAGLVMGTPAYLAPERLGGARPSERADLFALGVVLYEALSGVRPYPPTEAYPWTTALSGQTARPIRAWRPDVDPVLAGVVDRAVRLDPAARFPTAVDMAAALDRRPGPLTRGLYLAAALRGGRTRSRLVPVLTGTLAAGAALVVTLSLLIAGGPDRPAPAGTADPPTSTSSRLPTVAAPAQPIATSRPVDPPAPSPTSTQPRPQPPARPGLHPAKDGATTPKATRSAPAARPHHPPPGHGGPASGKP